MPGDIIKDLRRGFKLQGRLGLPVHSFTRALGSTDDSLVRWGGDDSCFMGCRVTFQDKVKELD